MGRILRLGSLQLCQSLVNELYPKVEIADSFPVLGRFHCWACTLGLQIVLMITGSHISREIFSIYMLTALKPYLEHDRKQGLYGDQT